MPLGKRIGLLPYPVTGDRDLRNVTRAGRPDARAVRRNVGQRATQCRRRCGCPLTRCGNADDTGCKPARSPTACSSISVELVDDKIGEILRAHPPHHDRVGVVRFLWIGHREQRTSACCKRHGTVVAFTSRAGSRSRLPSAGPAWCRFPKSTGRASRAAAFVRGCAISAVASLISARSCTASPSCPCRSAWVRPCAAISQPAARNAAISSGHTA